MLVIPHGLPAIIRTYGSPLDHLERKGEWEALILESRPLPTPLPYAYGYTDADGVRHGPATVSSIRAHRLVVGSMVTAIDRALQAGCPAERIVYGGAYCWRAMRGSTKLSTHTWAISIDIDPVNNPLGEPWVNDGMRLDLRIIEAFELEGALWGNNFTRMDPQHFQFATGY